MEENKKIESQKPPQNTTEEINSTATENILPKTETAASEQQQTTIPTSKIKDMEVHHHTHPGHHKKNWTDYFWEFLMLFLAVFCGFLAEYQLEHKIERDRGKQYIKSFYEDLTADERDLQVNIDFLRQQMRQADSLQELMLEINIKEPANRIYMYLRGITRSSAGLVHPNDRTIVQLRNAGGMRLIKSKSVSDSMVGYYRTAEIIQFLNQDGLISKTSLREKCIPLMNAADFAKIIDSSSAIVNPAENIYLRKADSDIINSCLIEVNRIKTLNGTIAIRIQNLKEMAGRIKEFIGREYHLTNE
ncbi:MAG: hypothetical protein ABIO81_11595 [Ginsengibacter sp.]